MKNNKEGKAEINDKKTLALYGGDKISSHTNRL